MNISPVRLLVKNKRKSLNDSSDIRAIALSSPKKDNLMTSDLQYDFKPKSSTTQYTSLSWSLLLTRNEIRQCYIRLSDASQAPAKENYVKSFQRLLHRKVNSVRVIVVYNTCTLISVYMFNGLVAGLSIFLHIMALIKAGSYRLSYLAYILMDYY